MEKDQLLNYQKRFTKLHFILAVILGIFYLERNITMEGGFNMEPLAVVYILVIWDFMAYRMNYWNSLSFLRVDRYIQLMAVAICIMTTNYLYYNIILYIIFGLFVIEYQSCYDMTDPYYVPATVGVTIVPILIVHILFVIVNSNYDKLLLVNLICLSVAYLVANWLFFMFVSTYDKMEKKYLAQCRYIEDANAVNQQLVENQEKVKKANEQLAYRRVELESANKRIKNVNTEIMLQNQILKIISANHEIDRLLSMIVATIRSQLNVDTIAIVLSPDAVIGKTLTYQVRTVYGPTYQQFIGEMIRSNELEKYINMNRTYVDNHVESGKYKFVKDTEVGAVLIIPLQREDKTIGGLYIADSRYEEFEDNVPFFEATVSSIVIAVDNANLYAKMEDMAIRDGLTGVFNRRYLNQMCEQFIYEAMAIRMPLSVALLDIDKFKRVNDSYGHLFGDDVLKMVASYASETAKENQGIVGRYGGEEFVIILPNTTLESMYDIVETLTNRVKSTILHHNGEDIVIRMSVGISSYPQTCENPYDLLNRSDWAMYYSKQNGRDRITVDSMQVREEVRIK